MSCLLWVMKNAITVPGSHSNPWKLISMAFIRGLNLASGDSSWAQILKAAVHFWSCAITNSSNGHLLLCGDSVRRLSFVTVCSLRFSVCLFFISYCYFSPDVLTSRDLQCRGCKQKGTLLWMLETSQNNLCNSPTFLKAVNMMLEICFVLTKFLSGQN